MQRSPLIPLIVSISLLATLGCSGKPKERAGEKAACAGMAVKPLEATLLPGETTTFVVSTDDGAALPVDLDWTLDKSLATITQDGRFVAPPQIGDVVIGVKYWRIPDDSGAYVRSNGKRYQAVCYGGATAHILASGDGGTDGASEAGDGALDAADASDGADASDARDAADVSDATSAG